MLIKITIQIEEFLTAFLSLQEQAVVGIMRPFPQILTAMLRRLITAWLDVCCVQGF